MKKAPEIKYQSSANLFQFCRRVLDHKFEGVRIIDQDVGQILGFDPADCSHWKKGKKNIRSIQAMKSIADHLGIDERLIVDVASGDIDDVEAFFEYSGYGTFNLDVKIVESAKKDYYRKNSGAWTPDSEKELKKYFSPNIAIIDELVRSIHEKIDFKEAPLYIPEVVAAYPSLKIIAHQGLDTNADATVPEIKHSKLEDGSTMTEISYPAGTETKPYMRFQLARGVGRHFLTQAQEQRIVDDSEFNKHLVNVECNLFAAKLLTPAGMIRKEISSINVSKDILTQLAEAFWVSKIFMNRRLKEILQDQPEI